ncbi:hypothetical protein L1987_45507 [Smallanthus sonchifolius]|uniref:Uncharacterized protein n=1 Tax=Smallanthus sonchifolius TaxID=185202 RepID=A0ACB9FX94_9ASTR|nr:hypothetical protein L1987_45507 [Smallanthus sonchifolius]
MQFLYRPLAATIVSELPLVKAWQKVQFLMLRLRRFCLSFGFSSTAHKVFDKSPQRHGHEALASFVQGNVLGKKPTKYELCSALNCCAKTLNSQLGSQIHGKIVHSGFDQNLYINSLLVNVYAKCGLMGDAMKVFNGMEVHDEVSWTSMICGLSQNGQGGEALCLFKEMMTLVRPNCVTYVSVISACTEQESVFRCGELLHAHVIMLGHESNSFVVHGLVTKMGSDQNTYVVGALINMYSKCGDIDEACHVFHQAGYKNNILWTSLITAYAQNGRGLDALKIFDHLVMEKRFYPDHICFTVVLTACNHSGLLDKGISYFKKMTSDYNLAPEIDQYACLIDLYARKGDLKSAKTVMEEMPFDANAVMWSSFLSSCKEYGNVELGREAAYKLFELEPCSPVPYLILADLYAGAGLWDEVKNIRKLMNENGVRKSLAGWSCVG